MPGMSLFFNFRKELLKRAIFWEIRVKLIKDKDLLLWFFTSLGIRGSLKLHSKVIRSYWWFYCFFLIKKSFRYFAVETESLRFAKTVCNILNLPLYHQKLKLLFRKWNALMNAELRTYALDFNTINKTRSIT